MRDYLQWYVSVLEKKSNFVETVLGFVGVDIIIESGWSLFRIKIEKYSKVNIIR